MFVNWSSRAADIYLVFWRSLASNRCNERQCPNVSVLLGETIVYITCKVKDPSWSPVFVSNGDWSHLCRRRLVCVDFLKDTDSDFEERFFMAGTFKTNIFSSFSFFIVRWIFGWMPTDWARKILNTLRRSSKRQIYLHDQDDGQFGMDSTAASSEFSMRTFAATGMSGLPICLFKEETVPIKSIL